MSVYRYIVNPETNRKVRIDGKIGRRVIQNYQMAGGNCGWLCRQRKKAAELAKRVKKDAKTLKIKKCGCHCQVEIPVLVKAVAIPFINNWDCKNMYREINGRIFAKELEEEIGIKLADKNGKPLKNLKCSDLIKKLKEKIKLERKDGKISIIIGTKRDVLMEKDLKKVGLTYKDLLKVLETFNCDGELSVVM